MINDIYLMKNTIEYKIQQIMIEFNHHKQMYKDLKYKQTQELLDYEVYYFNHQLSVRYTMFNSTFWTKYFFRVIHISSMVTICHAVINAKMTGELSKDYGPLYAVAGILVIISGYINTLLLKPKDMGEKRKLWISFHHIKLMSAVILFTPILKLFTSSIETRINLQFYWMILALLTSPFARFYREFFVAKEKEVKQKEGKFSSNSPATP